MKNLFANTSFVGGGLALALLMSVSAPAAAQVEKSSIKITLDWAFQGPQSIFTFAEAQGYFEREGIDVTIDRAAGTNETITRVASGAYDFGWADFPTMVKFNAANPEQGLIGVYMSGDKSPNAVMSIRGRGVETPKDLEGRNIGSTAGSAGKAMFPLFAEEVGIDLDKIEWTTVTGSLRESMLQRGDVDAVAGFQTSSVMSLVELGNALEDVVVFNYNDYGLTQYGTVLWTRAEFAEENPETVAAVVRAYNDALKGAIADPAASVATLKAYDGLLDLEVECARLLIALSLTATEDYDKNGLSSVDPDRLADSISDIRRIFEYEIEIPNDSVYTDAFLPPKEDRMPPALGSCDS
jgi:NitT/TauT family transport system substrate-binding protein